MVCTPRRRKVKHRFSILSVIHSFFLFKEKICNNIILRSHNLALESSQRIHLLFQCQKMFASFITRAFMSYLLLLFTYCWENYKKNWEGCHNLGVEHQVWGISKWGWYFIQVHPHICDVIKRLFLTLTTDKKLDIFKGRFWTC